LRGLLIEQVLTNLIENAIKWTPPVTEIVLSAQLVSAAVQIEVADRGSGLLPGEEQRIFEKFLCSPRAATSSRAWGWDCDLSRDHRVARWQNMG